MLYNSRSEENKVFQISGTLIFNSNEKRFLQKLFHFSTISHGNKVHYSFYVRRRRIYERLNCTCTLGDSSRKKKLIYGDDHIIQKMFSNLYLHY